MINTIVNEARTAQFVTLLSNKGELNNHYYILPLIGWVASSRCPFSCGGAWKTANEKRREGLWRLLDEWTFQFDLNEGMAWKGGKICRAVFTEWVWMKRESELSRMFCWNILRTILSEVVFILESCDKRWRFTGRSEKKCVDGLDGNYYFLCKSETKQSSLIAPRLPSSKLQNDVNWVAAHHR